MLVVLFERFGWTKDYILTLKLPEVILYLRAIKENNKFDTEEETDTEVIAMMAESANSFKTINYTATPEEWERLKNGK